MPIYRDPGRVTDEDKLGGTSAPQDDNAKEGAKDYSTLGPREIADQYENDARSSESPGFKTGAMIPSDMTVRLVRAESANWETLLSVLYSLCLTLFGVFAGSWSSSDSFSGLEKTATFGFLGLSLILIAIWATIKVRLQRGGVNVPLNTLGDLKEDDGDAEQGA